MVPGVCGAFHDDGVYALTAKALAGGEGYRLINLPEAPPQTKYPILYPATLALAWAAGGSLAERIVAMQVLTLLMAAASLACAYLYLVRFGYVARSSAFAGTLLCASASNVLYYATTTLSEMPFALLLVGALWATDRLGRSDLDPVARRTEFLVGVALAVPFLCRSVGVVVAPAALLALALQGRRLRWIAAGVGLTALPWLAWVATGAMAVATDPIISYQTDYFGWWTQAYGSLGPRVIWANLGKALAAFTHIGFEGFAAELYERFDSAAVLVAAIGVVPWVWIGMECRQLRPLPIVLAGYLALVCLWPWAPDRFVIPVLPLLAAGFFELLRRVFAVTLPKRAADAPGMLILLAAVALNYTLLVEYSTASRRSGYPYFMRPGPTVAWRSYMEAFDWLRERSEPDDIIATGFETMTSLYTSRRAVRLFVPRPEALYYGANLPLAGTLDDFDRVLETHRPRYLFLSPMPAFPEEEALYELASDYRRRHPGAITPVYRGTDPRFVILELKLGSLDNSSGDAGR